MHASADLTYSTGKVQTTLLISLYVDVTVCLSLSDSKTSEYMEVRYTTLSDVLVLSPYTETAREKTQAQGNVIVFTGCNVSQVTLKDWLRECAPAVSINCSMYMCCSYTVYYCIMIVAFCI